MASRRRLALVAVWVGPSAALLLLTAWIVGRYRIEPPQRLGPEARAAVVEVLREAVEDGATRAPEHPELGRSLPNRGPVVVTVWRHGGVQARVDAYADTVEQAVFEATKLLAQHPGVTRLSPSARQAVRIQVDVVVGRGALLDRWRWARAVALNPGIDGLGVTVDGRLEYLMLPDELYLRRLLFAEQPLAFVPEFTLGLDLERADMMLARQAQLPPGVYAAGERRYWRFRTDSFVEQREGARGEPPLALVRGLPPGPELTADNLRAAALAGGRYLVAHLAENGRYIYERDLTTGQGTDPTRPGPYSIPRHAGTTYFLAELYRLTGEEFLREPIERAFAHLEQLIRDGGCEGTLPGGAAYACVVDKGQNVAALGSTALTVVALAEYQRATGDDRYQALAERLTEWMLFMLRDDGSFAHLYDIAAQRRDEQTQLMYFSGEAALAMARMHLVTGDSRYRDAAEASLDWLVDWYDFFAGGFFYGEEHWTCIAAEAAYPAVSKDRYRRFCHGYGAFLRSQQPGSGDHGDQVDWVGSYGFTPFLPPHNTPAGSRSEAMISAYLLGRHHGRPDPEVRQQVLDALSYVLRQQIDERSDWNVALRAQGLGAVPGTPIDRKVRIDYVQHVCSAMIRAVEIL